MLSQYLKIELSANETHPSMKYMSVFYRPDAIEPFPTDVKCAYHLNISIGRSALQGAAMLASSPINSESTLGV